MENSNKSKGIKKMGREEFDEYMDEEKAALNLLMSYDDYHIWKDSFVFDIMTYEQYLKKYAKFFEEEDEEDEKEKTDNVVS